MKFQGSPHVEILRWYLHTCHQGKYLIFSNRNADAIHSSTPFLHGPPRCTWFLRNGTISVLAEITEALIAPQSQTGTRFPICMILPGTYTEPTFIPRSTWYEHFINYRRSPKPPQKRRSLHRSGYSISQAWRPASDTSPIRERRWIPIGVWSVVNEKPLNMLCLDSWPLKEDTAC